MPYKKTKPEDSPKCPHNLGIRCLTKNRNCGACGWDPNVAEERLIRFCRARGVQCPPKEKEETQG